ncbi:hypothetical protein SynRS9915_02227 [Synechococcus sp. RS9915]|nr:hypothetical protein SynRS9915_02227 [Synechococcus sp. RS9915]
MGESFGAADGLSLSEAARYREHRGFHRHRLKSALRFRRLGQEDFAVAIPVPLL